MKRIFYLLVLLVVSNRIYAQFAGFDESVYNGIFGEVTSSISKYKLNARKPYIVKAGNTLIYYSEKKRSCGLNLKNQNYSEKHKWLLDGPQDYFSLQITATQLIVHHRQEAQAACKRNAKGKPLAPEGFKTFINKKGVSRKAILPSFLENALVCNTMTYSNILVFQTPRKEKRVGKVIVTSPDYLEKNAIQTGKTLFAQSGNSASGNSAADTFAPWRVIKDDKIVISLDAMAKANKISKNELLWILYYTDFTDNQSDIFKGLVFSKEDNDALKYMLSQTFGLKKKTAEGQAYASRKTGIIKKNKEEKERRYKEKCQKKLDDIDLLASKLEKDPYKDYKNYEDAKAIEHCIDNLNKIEKALGSNDTTNLLRKRLNIVGFTIGFKYNEKELFSSSVIDYAKNEVARFNYDSLETVKDFIRILNIIGNYAYMKKDKDAQSYILSYIEYAYENQDPTEEIVPMLVKYGKCIMSQNRSSSKDDIRLVKSYVEELEPISETKDNVRMYNLLVDMYRWNKKENQAQKIIKTKLSIYDPDGSIRKEIRQEEEMEKKMTIQVPKQVTNNVKNEGKKKPSFHFELMK